MANLLDSVKEYLHPGFIAEAAEQLSEGEEQTAKALYAWCATILAGLLDWAGHTKAMNNILEGLDHFPPNLTDDPKALLRSGNLAHNDPKEISGQLLGQLFGAKTPALTNAIAAFSGARPDNVSYLLGIAGPVALSILGHRVQVGALTAAGLSNMLLGNQERVLAALPNGVGAILDLSHIKQGKETDMEAATGFRWATSLALMLGLGIALLLYIRFCR